MKAKAGCLLGTREGDRSTRDLLLRQKRTDAQQFSAEQRRMLHTLLSRYVKVVFFFAAAARYRNTYEQQAAPYRRAAAARLRTPVRAALRRRCSTSALATPASCARRRFTPRRAARCAGRHACAAAPNWPPRPKCTSPSGEVSVSASWAP